MFYNEPQKIEYLESEDNRFLPSTLEVAKRIFVGSAMVEKQYDTDLSNFNRQQVVDLLKKFNATSKGYYKMICLIFADYYNWCLSKEYIDQSNFTNWYDSKLSNLIIDEILPVSLVKGKFFTKEDVLEYLDKIKSPTNRLLLYSPFMGIDGVDHEDLKYLRVSDLYEKRKAIQLHSGAIQPVDDLFIQLLKEADAETMYNPEGKENYTIRRNIYDESVYVLKKCSSDSINEVINKQIIVYRMKVIKKQAENKFISISTLYKNGLINSIKEYYEQKNISLYKALFHEKNKKLYTYDEETQEVISRFNSNMTVRMLRMELKDTIDYYI